MEKLKFQMYAIENRVQIEDSCEVHLEADNLLLEALELLASTDYAYQDVILDFVNAYKRASRHFEKE